MECTIKKHSLGYRPSTNTVSQIQTKCCGFLLFVSVLISLSQFPDSISEVSSSTGYYYMPGKTSGFPNTTHVKTESSQI